MTTDLRVKIVARLTKSHQKRCLQMLTALLTTTIMKTNELMYATPTVTLEIFGYKDQEYNVPLMEKEVGN